MNTSQSTYAIGAHAPVTMIETADARRRVDTDGLFEEEHKTNASGETALCRPFPPARTSERHWRNPWTLALSVLLLMSFQAVEAESVLTLAQTAAPSDGNVTPMSVSLSASPGQRVAALQFDVAFDPAALAVPPTGGVETGAPAKAAGKQTQYSPTGPGEIRVLVVGFNQEAISDGEVARLSFATKNDPLSAMQTVHIRNVVMSDPNGVRIPAVGRDGGVRPVSLSAATAPAEQPRPLMPLAATACVACGATVLAGAAIGYRYAREKTRPGSKHGKSNAAPAHKHARAAR